MDVPQVSLNGVGAEDDVQLVVLTPERLTGQGVSGGDVRPFRDVAAAITFAMEHLSPEERELAFIRTGEAVLQSADIERIYREMSAGTAVSAAP